MFIEYILIFKYLFFCFFVSILLVLISTFFVYQIPNFEKVSVYECGFSPFSDSRSKFEVKFYIIAILFIVFDLEIVFLFPWVVIFETINYISFFSMFLFLFILLIGFFYEWIKGALEWE